MDRSFIVKVECKEYVKIRLGIIYISFLSRFLRLGRFCVHQFYPLSPPRRLAYSPSPYSPVSSLPYSYDLPIDAARRFFKVLRIQYLDLCSVFVDEVTQVNSISVSPIPVQAGPVA